MGDSVIDPANGNADPQSGGRRSGGQQRGGHQRGGEQIGGQQNRQEWIRANFAQIFDTSAEDLQRQGIDPRQYAQAHRDQIRRFAQMQRRQGIAVPGGGRPPGGLGPANRGPNTGGPASRGYGYGGRRFGMGMRGGTAWIGIVIVLFAVRFLLVDSFAGSHVAIFWVLGIGGIMLVLRVLLFSWFRRRRFNRRQSGGQPNAPSGF